jgi:hypothetical protein
MCDIINWALLLACVTGLVNQELLLQNEYLTSENRILRGHLPRMVKIFERVGNKEGYECRSPCITRKRRGYQCRSIRSIELTNERNAARNIVTSITATH